MNLSGCTRLVAIGGLCDCPLVTQLDMRYCMALKCESMSVLLDMMTDTVCDDCAREVATFGLPRDQRKRWCASCAAGACLARGCVRITLPNAHHTACASHFRLTTPSHFRAPTPSLAGTGMGSTAFWQWVCQTDRSRASCRVVCFWAGHAGAANKVYLQMLRLPKHVAYTLSRDGGMGLDGESEDGDERRLSGCVVKLRANGTTVIAE